MSYPRLRPLGDAAWTVELGEGIDPAVHQRVMGLARAIEAAREAGGLDGVTEWVPSFRSLAVFFDPLAVDADAMADRLRAMANAAGNVEIRGRRWRLPALFGGEAGPDLETLARAKALTPEAVVARMTVAVFRVFVLGFMPGFPYMGGLPGELTTLRRQTPRTRVPARSVAVAGKMCGIYPYASPGGWHLLGRTPVPLFDAGDEHAPALLAPGDEVSFEAISADVFARIEDNVKAGRFDRSSLAWRP